MQFFAALADVLALLLGAAAAFFGSRSLKEGVQTKKKIVNFSRGNVALQKAAVVSLEDQELSKDEIEEFSRLLEDEIRVSSTPKETKRKMQKMIRAAALKSSSRRLLQEILYEVLDEVEQSSKKSSKN